MSKKSIQAALDKLEARFGTPVVQKMSETNTSIKTFPCGRAPLDSKLGGGFAIGKIIEIYGEEATGKTGIALEAVKEVQAAGGTVGYIDTEHALNTEYCEQIGVNIDDLYLSQPDFGEQAFEAIKAMIQTGEFNLIVVDSVAAMIPKAELEGESGEAKMGLHARIMSQGLKMITAPAADAECTIIFINQLRATIAMYGPAKKPTGGNALKFYASQRLEVKNKGKVTQGQEVIGFKQLVRIVKNKVAAPFKEVETDIVYGKGADELGGLIEALKFEEILIQKGAWYAYDGTNIAKGMKNLRTMLEDNPELLEELRSKLH